MKKQIEKEKQKKLKGKSPRYTEHYVIDSQTGNKTTKEKNKKNLFNTFNKNYFIENNKNFSLLFSNTFSTKR